MLSVSGKSSRIEDEEVKRSFGDLDFSLRYRLNKFDIKLTGENVFHLRGNEWIKKILSPTVQSTVLYRRINKVIESTPEEKNILGALTELDDVVQGMRNKLRYGERLELDFEIKKK